MGEIACASQGCAHRFWLPEAVERRLRRTGEKFFCPAGHRQFFTADAHPERKRIQQLERELRRANERAARFHKSWEDEIQASRELDREVLHFRRVLYGSTSLYECRSCGHQHRFDSEVGQDHLEHAVLRVALEADIDVGVQA